MKHAKTIETRGNEGPLADDQYGTKPWISRFNIDYTLGIDGISMPLILLTTALCFLAMIASFHRPSTCQYCNAAGSRPVASR